MAVNPPDRTARRIKPISTSRIREEAATIVGAGGVGRQVALQLVSLGVRKLTIIDPDIVQSTEVITGGFRTDDVGRPRVDAVGEVCHQANPQLDFAGLQERFHSTSVAGATVFCCVDRTATRKVVWLGVEQRCRFWADVRVVGEAARVLVATDEASKRRYAKALGEQAPKPRRKPLPTFVCAAALAASLAVHQYTRYLRDLTVVDEVELDPLADRFEATGFMDE